MNELSQTPETVAKATQARQVRRGEEVFLNLGGRRFVMVMGCSVVCTLLVWHAKITPEIFRDIIIATVAVYVGGNTYQKVKATGGEATNAP
jgi:hypothetical protein